MKYKLYWRFAHERIGRWAIFSDRSDADAYRSALLDAGATVNMVEIPKLPGEG